MMECRVGIQSGSKTVKGGGNRGTVKQIVQSGRGEKHEKDDLE